MVTTEKLIYLQLHKTGCTHVGDLLCQTFDGRQVGKHNRFRGEPKGRLVAGSVRNPWDWYVSLWAFGCAGKGATRRRVTRPHRRLRRLRKRLGSVNNRNPGNYLRIVRRHVSDYRRPVGTWTRAYSDPYDAKAFRRWLELLLCARYAREISRPYGAGPIHSVAGLLTYRYLWLYSRNVRDLKRADYFADLDALAEFDASNNVLDVTIRNEYLEPDLVSCLNEAGYRLNDEQLQTIRAGSENKLNTSRREPSTYYYDRKTLDLVAARERFIIEKYGYEPPLVN